MVPICLHVCVYLFFHVQVLSKLLSEDRHYLYICLSLLMSVCPPLFTAFHCSHPSTSVLCSSNLSLYCVLLYSLTYLIQLSLVQQQKSKNFKFAFSFFFAVIT